MSDMERGTRFEQDRTSWGHTAKAFMTALAGAAIMVGSWLPWAKYSVSFWGIVDVQGLHPPPVHGVAA